MKVEQHISETAFLTNESRRRLVSVSRDIYAHLWVTPKTRKIWDDFARVVYSHDDVELSIRNRYYLEHLEAFVKNHPDGVFINIAAGFTSYPFLISTPCQCVEIDYAHVIDFKQSKVAQWQEEGLLPNRPVTFFPCDLADEKDFGRLRDAFARWTSDRPSFVLLEGITYYLAKAVLDRLLTLFQMTQTTGSVLGLEYWTPDIVNHPVFIRLEDYFERRFGCPRGTYNLIDDDFIRSLVRICAAGDHGRERTGKNLLRSDGSG